MMPNLVPAVNPDDLKKAWQLWADATAQGRKGILADEVYAKVSSPAADVVSIWYRASILSILKQVMPELFGGLTKQDQLDDVVFRVAATFPMEEVTDVVRQGLPLDVEAFAKQLAAK